MHSNTKGERRRWVHGVAPGGGAGECATAVRAWSGGSKLAWGTSKAQIMPLQDARSWRVAGELAQAMLPAEPKLQTGLT